MFINAIGKYFSRQEWQLLDILHISYTFLYGIPVTSLISATFCRQEEGAIFF